MKIYIFLVLLMVAAFFAGRFVTAGNNTTISFAHLAPEQFNADLSTGEFTLLDVRTADEYAAGHLKDAKLIDYYQTKQFSDYLDTLDKKRKYRIYCRTGHRSGLALKIMQEKGFKNAADMAGGYNAWSTDNFAVEK